MTIKPLKILEGSLVTLLIFQLVGCGTILYPERKGQKDGRLDVGVVLLDTVGLLCFIIPGVIAFAVDFSNGTIYLPGGMLSSNAPSTEIKFDPKHTSVVQIEKMIKDQTGRSVRLTQGNIQVTRVNSQKEMLAYIGQALPSIQSNRLAYSQ